METQPTSAAPTPKPSASEAAPIAAAPTVPPAAAVEEQHGHSSPKGAKLWLLALSALGIVYGDIGTSPLYAFRESFREHEGLAVTPANILGILSLIFWSLILVISIKYIVFVMRADNRGEGGILALTALVTPMTGVQRKTRRWALILLGLFGTSLLYGDGMITPSISVLSAVEGLEVATPFFTPYIIPITIAILVGLFLFQSQGTERVGKIFGPITLLWFLTLAVLGVMWIVRRPEVFQALNPLLGLEFFIRNGWTGFLVLGSVFLVVTGGEALYADMGHFGRSPIRLAWFVAVLPALVLNYFGQGALLLEDPAAVENPFYHMAPEWALYPVVILATLATVIASQALITGAFSLTRQAVQLGYMPRVRIEQTSATEYGQIYIPVVNWILMVACVALVLIFGSSSNLAAAYGLAVTSTMVITTLLLGVAAHEKWGWSIPVVGAFSAFFLIIDLSFLGANIVKIPDGGWVPLVVGAAVFVMMTTWKRGRKLLRERTAGSSTRYADFVNQVQEEDLACVHGTAVFMYSDPECVPPALLHNMEHNHVLHSEVIHLSIETREVPTVRPERRIQVRDMGNGFYQVILRYGFMEDPHVPRDLALAKQYGLDFDDSDLTYFLGRERVIPSDAPGMSIWREKLFALMTRNARSATDFYHLPPDRVVELGGQVEI